jgi:type IV secretion system protein VirB10
MSALHATETEPAPNVAIRARPPSPKRLSRKVLLGAAILASTIISVALVMGLSTHPHRVAATQEAATASGPPETIALASSQYDAATLGHGRTEAAPALDTTSALAPPDGGMFAPASETAPVQGGGQGGVRPPQAVDPEAVARTSPILFNAAAHADAGVSRSRDDGEANLDAALIPPRSPYAILSGSVIPAALVTGLNSDLSGRVIAQVTAPVYDSVTGSHLLIPQGARLIGSYENGVRYGDRRILLNWNRLILPNGWSINLRQMNAADPTGAAGLSDTVDNHLGPLARAIGLSTIISVIANESQSDRRDNASLAQDLGDAAAQQAAQTGSQVVERDLSVHPTLTVRPGASVRVLVMRDMTLRPYRERP